MESTRGVHLIKTCRVVGAHAFALYDRIAFQITVARRSYELRLSVPYIQETVALTRLQ